MQIKTNMIAIIDYGVGNLSSVSNALKSIGVEAEITNDLAKIRAADKIILPGVGAFRAGMENLRKLKLVDILQEEVIIKKKPFLGICLGMQLIFTKSYEDGETAGLDWIKGEVICFDVEKQGLRVPHIGWNEVKCDTNSLLFKGGPEIQHFYFVHSFYPVPEEKISIGICNYGVNFTAVLQKENIFATQFHPEKSQHEGLEILRRFAML